VQIFLADTDKRVVDAWNQKMGGGGTHGDLFSVEAEAVVSPANSFGFMDGNVDYRISDQLGWHIMQRLQSAIQHNFDGELLVGQAHFVYTEHPIWRWLISAPTMRVPTKIVDPTAIYLAARAAIRVTRKIKIRSILFTGMGTGCGEVDAESAVALMVRGISDGMVANKFPASWRDAQTEHNHIAHLGRKPHIWGVRTTGNVITGSSVAVCTHCGVEATLATNKENCERR
jgi:O-acetyl-ADP-ribose deacetylase (regulator of RNase III)